MKKILYLLLSIPVWLLSACEVHEWPDTPEYVKLHLRMNYETEMTEWLHHYEGDALTEQGLGNTYDNRRAEGRIRYVVRTFPISQPQRSTSDYTQEFVFTKDLAEGYDHEITLDVLPGNYNFMVWSDLISTDESLYYHNADNFADVRLQGEHKGNDDFRDAFRGMNSISLVADITERLPDTLDIAMQRPLAKFEFVTGDVAEFIEKESARAVSRSGDAKDGASDDAGSRVLNIEDYKVVFHYVGFMPNAYSMYTDKPVDSSTGVTFESSLKKISESEASMGFDYVFVNGKASAVTVQVGIYDRENTQLALTEPIEVPLKRSHHTILRGMFLMSQATGGVTINPSFDGDYNLIFK